MSSTADRIATAVLKTAAEEALSLVPIAGPMLNIGVGLVQNLIDEFDEDRGVSVEDVARALHRLPFSEARRIADEAMASPSGVEALRGLSDAERAGVKHQLVGLPTALEDVLQEIDRREHAAARSAAESARLTALGRHGELHDDLVRHLRDGEYAAAYAAIDQILAIRPRDGRALKAQRFLDRRTGRRRLLPRLGKAFVLGALLAAAVPAALWVHDAPAEPMWHTASGTLCSPYLPSAFDDPCLRDSVELRDPFPAADASRLAAVGGAGLALLVGLISIWLYTRRLTLIWVDGRRARRSGGRTPAPPPRATTP